MMADSFCLSFQSNGFIDKLGLNRGTLNQLAAVLGGYFIYPQNRPVLAKLLGMFLSMVGARGQFVSSHKNLLISSSILQLDWAEVLFILSIILYRRQLVFILIPRILWNERITM